MAVVHQPWARSASALDGAQDVASQRRGHTARERLVSDSKGCQSRIVCAVDQAMLELILRHGPADRWLLSDESGTMRSQLGPVWVPSSAPRESTETLLRTVPHPRTLSMWRFRTFHNPPRLPPSLFFQWRRKPSPAHTLVLPVFAVFVRPTISRPTVSWNPSAA